MEKLKDILDNLKDRFTNPLVFSFICSWIVINWKVTIALLWYDSKEIEEAGFKTIYDFISANLNLRNSILLPLLFCLAYTIFMPIIKNLVRALYTWTSKWGENWNLNILKGGKIPIDKYFRFREDYDKRTKILVDIISKENVILDNYDALSTSMLQIQANENKLRQELAESKNFIARSTDVRLLNGRWVNTYQDNILPTFRGIEEVMIENGAYYTIEKFGEKLHRFNIVNFHFNSDNGQIFFIKEIIGQEKTYIPIPQEESRAILRYNPNNLHFEHQDLLVGFENGTTRIKYERI